MWSRHYRSEAVVRRLPEHPAGVGIILNLRVERERIGIVLCCRVHMGQVFTIHLLYSDKWGDGVSFVESLPRP